MAPGANGMASKNRNRLLEDWPDWAKFWLALATMIIIGGVWVGLPVLSALESVKAQGSGTVDYSPMMSVYIAMTTATITGIFLFMTLRIDRGTRFKAESVAKDKMDKIVAEKIEEMILGAVNSQITEEKLREHVEAILMVTANGEIVRRFAAERAENLDPQTVKQLIGLLKEVSETLLRAIEDKRGFWAKLFRRAPRPAE